MSRRLRGGIPRALADHRGADGAAYGRYARAKVARVGRLPADAVPWLKEAGRLTVALDRLHAEVETLRAALASGAGRRLREKLRGQLRSLESRGRKTRASLEAAERRIEELSARAPAPPRSGAELLAHLNEARP